MEMLRRHRKVLLGLAIALTLTACSTHRTPIAAARDDYLKVSAPAVEGAKTRAQGAVIGALVGAAIAVAVSAALGVDVTPLAPAVGAGVGTLVGIAYAEHVVHERQAYANASAYLAARRAALSSHIAAAHKFNTVLDHELTSLATDHTQTESAIDDADKVRQRLREEIEREEDALTKSRQEGVSEGDVSQQEQRINDLRAEESRLATHLDRLSDYLRTEETEGKVIRRP
jgi:uncharacterized protein YcfJ